MRNCNTMLVLAAFSESLLPSGTVQINETV
jgi:hypothetical protein